jgi:hypothetical protein
MTGDPHVQQSVAEGQHLDGAGSAPAGRGRAWVLAKRVLLSGLEGIGAYLFAVVLVGFGYFGGWFTTREPEVRFIADDLVTIDAILAAFAEVGVACPIRLERDRFDDVEAATCRGALRFDLHVFDSVTESYLSLDRASHIGCYTVGNLPYPAWYMVRDANWNVLTHSADVAKKLGLISGTTSASGRCSLTTADEPA